MGKREGPLKAVFMFLLPFSGYSLITNNNKIKVTT